MSGASFVQVLSVCKVIYSVPVVNLILEIVTESSWWIMIISYHSQVTNGMDVYDPSPYTPL